MRKLLSLVLAVLLIASMSVTVFAEEVGSGNISGGQTGDVQVNIIDSNDNNFDPETIYNVVIAWESLVFDVKAETATWNTTTLKYDLTGAVVSGDKRAVTVTNNSNADVAIYASFPSNAKDATSYGITASLTGTDRTLKSAVNRPAADVMEYEVSVAGTPNQIPDMVHTINRITIVVSKV